LTQINGLMNPGGREDKVWGDGKKGERPAQEGDAGLDVDRASTGPTPMALIAAYKNELKSPAA
jgi:hypothetical protein